jgi:hypothetical protein
MRDRHGLRRVSGCLAIAACLAWAARASPLAMATEPAPADVAVEAIPPPVPEEWEAEFDTAGASCAGCTGAESAWHRGRFHVDYDNGFAILPNDPDETP